MRSIICFGDSITQQGFRPGFWLGLLAAHFETKCDVLNRGFSGYTTQLALDVAMEVAFGNVTQSPLVVTIFFGANDAALPICNQHVPIGMYRKNLAIICERLRAKWPDVSLVLISPPPVDDEKWAKHCGGRAPNRLLEVTRTYRDACEAVASENGAAFVDLFDGRFDHGRDILLSDGLHLTPAGNEVLFNAVLERLPRHVVSMDPAFPHWAKLLEKK